MSSTVPHDTQSSSFYLIGRLLKSYITPYKGTLFFAIVCMIAVAATTAIQAKLIEPILDKIFIDKNMDLLLYVAGLVLGVSIVKGLASYGQLFSMKYLGQRIITNMQIELYEHLLKADIKMFGEHGSGKLLSRFTNDIIIMRRSVSNVLTGIAKDMFMLVGLVYVMFHQNWLLAILAFTVFPVAIYPILRLGKRMRKLSHDTQVELGNYTARLDETFQGARVVKAYNREAFEAKRASHIMEDLFTLYVKAARTESLASPIMETLGGIAIAGVVWYGGYQVITGETTPGAFFSFLTALMLAYKPMKSLAGFNTALQEGLAAARRLFTMLDIEPEVTDKKGAKALKVSGGGIVFNDVSFQYSIDKSALQHINFTVPAGKTVALVGASGGGKSTIMSLLLRFYDPSSGSICIDQQPITDVTQASLRNALAIVNQEVILFDDTVSNNIRYGNLKATKKHVMEAARQAGADQFIKDLPNGYDTVIGQHGLRLSGGQRQRIAIARAILKDAPILLLDEATSALDTVSEKHIQRALKTLMKDRTTLIIAHRLSTIIDADIIYVVDNGRIIEYGSHQDLLHANGAYKQLYANQSDGLII